MEMEQEVTKQKEKVEVKLGEGEIARNYQKASCYMYF